MESEKRKRLAVARILRENFAKAEPEEFARHYPGRTMEERRVKTSAGETSVLVYRPQNASDLLPVFVCMHGGGFGLGCAADEGVWCQRIADAAECCVVNVDYRLSPEHAFPVALEECHDVVKWLQTESADLGVDGRRVAVGGHSAGANLAAALCLLFRQRRDDSIALQILNGPPLDLSRDPFRQEFQDMMLKPKVQEFFTACYLQDPADAKNPLASPLQAEDLSGLPPALMIAAEYDPLRAEDELYAKRLAQAGVDVTYRCFAGCRHAFTHLEATPASEKAWDLICAHLHQAFSIKRN